MFQPIYPSPYRGLPFKAHDMEDRLGIKGNESRRIKCRFCGFVNDPDERPLLRDGDFAGKGIDYGSRQSATITYPTGKTETNYYYEITVNGGCSFCGSLIYG